MLKVLLTDDQTIIRRGIRQILQEEFSFVQIEEIVGTEQFLTKAETGEWDILIADPAIPGIMEVIRKIKQQQPKLPLLALISGPEEQIAAKALQQGADGCLNKDAEAIELVKAVRQVMAGRKYIPAGIVAGNYQDEDTNGLLHEKLSERELNVFRLLASGKTVAEISTLLSLQSNTVSTYRSRLLGKMNMRTNADILRYAMEHNLL